MPGPRITVMVVDDSPFMRGVISDMLDAGRDIEVVCRAKDGREAVEKARMMRPDVIVMDIEMPRMDGLSALCYIMATDPVPIVMLSAMGRFDPRIAIKCLDYGAVDFVAKPSDSSRMGIELLGASIVERVRTASSIKPAKRSTGADSRSYIDQLLSPPETDMEALVIGASTGGPRVISEIMPRLHRNFPLTVIIVQHMPVGFTRSFSERLAWTTSIELKEAEDGDLMDGSRALIAPAGRHLVVKGRVRRRVSLNDGPPVNSVRPSIDVTMRSIAEAYGDRAMGVLLTGMGRDGVDGMAAIRDAGGTTIAQDEASSAVFGMPRRAIEAGVVDVISPADSLVDAIMGAL